MFRIRLAIIIFISFGFVLVLGIAQYGVANQVAQYFQRSQKAYDAFDQYERLSQEAYRHFKQRMDRLLITSPTVEAGVESSKIRLNEAMEELRNTAISATPKERTANDTTTKPAELERVARFTVFLDASEFRFDEVERLSQQGQQNQAVQALAKFSKEEIDGKFQPLIDAAIDAEREKASKAKLELQELLDRSRWLAILASLAAALFSLVSGFALLRGFKKPVEALMKGTDEIASGNLDYRISLDTRDEFAYLANHFNLMAQELELQQGKLREGRAVLEKKVTERTVELRRLNEELKRMDHARREFLADISHELRTPITVIQGEAEVTLRGQKRNADEYKLALERIVELAMQLGKYVSDLMFLARAETANFQFEWDNVNLVELVASATEDFQVMAEEYSLTVSLDAPERPLWVRGDKQRLRQVLFILGENACRYSKPGGHIGVVIKAYEKDASFSLSDQGIGIPVSDLEKIFERNFRSQNALHTRDDGTGLGLAMAKSIVKTHNGLISVTSTENLGSTFTVTLPLLPNKPDGDNTMSHHSSQI